MSKKNRTVFTIYLVMLISTMTLFFINNYREVNHKNKDQNIPTISYAEGWADENGLSVNPEKINLAKDHPVGKQFTIYKQFLNDTEYDMTLMFRSIGLCFFVSIDDTVLYSYEMDSEHVFGNSTGSVLHQIIIPKGYNGKTLSVTCATSYNESYECLSEIFIGSSVQMIREKISGNLIQIILCLLLMTIGFLYILLDFPINRILNSNHSLLYLGFFSIVVGTWSATETHLPDLFIQSNQALNCFSLMQLSLAAIPLGLFLSVSFPVQYPRLLRIGYVFSIVGFIACMLLYLTGTADFNQSLIIAHSAMAYYLVIIIFDISVSIYRKQCVGVEKGLILISLFAMAICVPLDLIASKISYHADNSRFTRVGMLTIAICFGTVTCLQMIKRFKEANQFEVISQLAYKDGLTGIGNRTAFNERIETLSPEQLSVVMFDVNNLKTANDRYGHQQGDILIQSASKTIQKAFSEIGDAYRIGGDEFVVLVTETPQPECIEHALTELEQQIESFNEQKISPVPLSIANGFACSQTEPYTIEVKELINLADERMYENKRKMKSMISAK